MIKQFLEKAEADLPVYISHVRAAFEEEGRRPFHIWVALYDGGARRFPLTLPEADGEKEERFIASYVHAMLYNILSALGAVRISIYFDHKDKGLCRLFDGLDALFQTSEAKRSRTGYGKCLNVNERTLSVLAGEARRFAFEERELEKEPPYRPIPAAKGAKPVFGSLPEKVKGRMLLGMDIGGTDIKLAASVDGRLAVCKEFDWFPAGFEEAGQLIDPILLLARLMRAAASLCASGRGELLDKKALGAKASIDDIEKGTASMEMAAKGDLENFDAIGLCFPDVVIRGRIVGGETYKTRGMRANKILDYEKQFAKITPLSELLSRYTKTGVVMNTNDGPMAAFTAAVEQAAGGADLSDGFFAHTLGTELGTGWVKPDGSIPEIPLEVYNFIIDLGSFGQRKHVSDDIRSINNFNTGLPGTLQKYTCQSGVFRLAAKYLPEGDPALLRDLLEAGLFAEKDGKLLVPTAPVDLRKPCLEFFMDKAAKGHPICQEIFRQVGEFLAIAWRETQYILNPEASERRLFGRLVKNPICFDLIRQGASRLEPSLRQHAADSSIANTNLMKQLASAPGLTVAQFAQAVGAVYYGCLGLPSDGQGN